MKRVLPAVLLVACGLVACTLTPTADLLIVGANVYLTSDIRPLKLAAEDKRALVAFLRALTGVRGPS